MTQLPTFLDEELKKFIFKVKYFNNVQRKQNLKLNMMNLKRSTMRFERV